MQCLVAQPGVQERAAALALAAPVRRVLDLVVRDETDGLLGEQLGAQGLEAQSRAGAAGGGAAGPVGLADAFGVLGLGDRAGGEEFGRLLLGPGGLAGGGLGRQVLGLGAVAAVAVLDLVEEQVQRLEQVEAAPGALADEVAQDEVAEALEAVPPLVLRVVGGQDAERGAGLGVQQEQDPVQVAQRLAAELLGQAGRVVEFGRGDAVLRFAQAVQDLARDPLDAQAQALAQFGGDADGVLAGLVEEGGERCGATLGGDAQRVGAEQRGHRVEFAAVAVVAAVERRVEVGGQVAALVPGEAVGEDDDAADEQQDIARRCVAGEEEVGDGLGVHEDRRSLQGDGVEQAAGAVRVESGVGLGGPAAGDGVQAGFRVGDLDGVLVVGAVDGDSLLVGGGVAEGVQGVQMNFGAPLLPALGLGRIGVGERFRVLGEGGAAREVGAAQGAQSLTGVRARGGTEAGSRPWRLASATASAWRRRSSSSKAAQRARRPSLALRSLGRTSAR